MGYIVVERNTILNLSKLGLKGGDTVKIYCIGGGGGGGGGNTSINSYYSSCHGGAAGYPGGGYIYRNSGNHRSYEQHGGAAGTGYGAGGGGGQAANKTYDESNQGYGGRAGSVRIREIKLRDDELEVPITIGAGGTGGSTNGSNGGSTSFGTYLTAEGGYGGGAHNVGVSRQPTDVTGSKESHSGGDGLDFSRVIPEVTPRYSNANKIINYGTAFNGNTSMLGDEYAVLGIGHGVLLMLW